MLNLNMETLLCDENGMTLQILEYFRHFDKQLLITTLLTNFNGYIN